MSMMRERIIRAGKDLVKQGELPREMYVVQHGKFHVVRKAGDRTYKLGHVGPGDYVGEPELVDEEPRMATITADVDSQVRIVKAEEFRKDFDALDPIFQAVLSRSVAILRESHDFYAKNIMTAVFTSRKTVFAQGSERRKYAKGDVIIAQDTAPEAMYVIESGLVEVTRKAKGEMFRLSQLGRNCLIGEIGMVDLAPRAATVTALRDTVCYEIPKAEFRKRFEELTFFKSIMLSLVSSIRHNHEVMAAARA